MTKTLSALALLLALAVSPVAAEAQERRSPLADAPAIRHRVELLDKRLEIGAGIGSTIGQDYYHAVLVNARLAFHLTDWLSLAGTFGHNLTPGFTTAFHDRLVEALDDTTKDRTPTRQQALDGMNRIGQVVAVQGELVPFTGKLALFSKLFMSWDLYAFGGPGFINFKADAPCTADNQPSCAVTGFKMGANFGIGMHAFVNEFAAVNIELRDILVRNNPAGRDVNADVNGAANKDDLTWDSNFMLTVNLMLFLPKRAEIGP